MKKIIFQKAENNFTMIIFGASGSLAKLKLFPSIYQLAAESRLPADYKIIGYGRSQISNEDFREFFKKSVIEKTERVDLEKLDELLKNIFYVSGQYNEEKDFRKLRSTVEQVEKTKNRIRIAYFSVPPSAFTEIFQNLAAVNFNSIKAKLRLVIEKPFGYDFKSAKKLAQTLKKHFSQEQIYLLDHYLGKESVTNLLSLRYANSILTTLLNREYVSNIQISALESKDIEGRANYFDNVGILRDMVQSHLLQILAYLTMFMPRERTAEAIHHEKAQVLKSIRVNSLVRGQYIGYNKEVSTDSKTETYAAIKLALKHPLWKGVPIYLRSGKSLVEQWTAIVFEFKPRKAQRDDGTLPPNRIVIQLQPYEKIEFHLLTKLGGKTFDFHELTTGRPIYCSGDCLNEHGRLLLDVIAGKNDLFLNFEEIFAAWKVIDPLQKLSTKMKKKDLHLYKKGSKGPKASDELLAKDGFKWFYSLPNA